MKKLIAPLALLWACCGTAHAQWGYPNAGANVGSGWGGGLQWNVSVGTGYNAYPYAQVPVAVPAYPAYYPQPVVPVVPVVPGGYYAPGYYNRGYAPGYLVPRGPVRRHRRGCW